jgi:hypothetical protein
MVVLYKFETIKNDKEIHMIVFFTELIDSLMNSTCRHYAFEIFFDLHELKVIQKNINKNIFKYLPDEKKSNYNEEFFEKLGNILNREDADLLFNNSGFQVIKKGEFFIGN